MYVIFYTMGISIMIYRIRFTILCSLALLHRASASDVAVMDDTPIIQRYRMALKEGDTAILRCIEDERLPVVSISDIKFARARQFQQLSIDPVCFDDVSQQAQRANDMAKFCNNKPGCILKAADPAVKPECRSAYLLIRYSCAASA
ncbi:uncharacterized protein LOC129601404 [Paramacrobiotus metropolitanus]|uniref:uncharacterized protein LOC129601404 n=1 Tax=Paramacrobiotus metropolitanus TaxID=2943436 RepID=UPI0024458C69|nr:uncharacterized protein LOC129601404 [Paramacrobiotus metropolitanus]